MGIAFSAIYKKWFGNRETKLLMLGLDAAGKTTILYNLKLNEKVLTIPTIGFNVETVEFKGFNMNIWDIGGQERLRKLWRHYYARSHGLIFVVDCNDVNRIEDARKSLFDVLDDDEMRDAVLLVYANKQDLPNAIKPAELSEKLGLNTLRNRPWYVQGTCAATGDGLFEGLDWLGKQINERF